MQPNFLIKTSVRTDDLIGISGIPIIDRFSALRDQLISRLGREVAAIFAEPVISRRDVTVEIAWYSEALGDPRPLSSLDDDARKTVGDKLSSRLAALAPLLDDPAIGPLLSRALYVADANAIFAVGREPVLTGWGVMSNWRSADGAARARQFAATLGTYSPFPAPRWIEPVQTALAPAAGAFLASTEHTSSPPAGARGLYIATGVAALVLLLLALPGVLRLLPPAATAGADDLAAQREITKAMAEKVERARAALASARCDPSGELGPGPKSGKVDPLPPAPIGADQGKAKSGMALVAERASQAVVFVFTCKDKAAWSEERKDLPDKGEPISCPEGTSGQPLFFADTGSGFFVNPTTVVTNTHVVEGAEAVFVTSKYLAKVQRARVVAKTVKRFVDDRDFAALEVQVDKPPEPIQLTTNVTRLENVVAAGYPGVIIENDPQTAKLARGDPAASPELTTFPGFVTLIMRSDSEVPLIFSSATIGHGNSGGPLLNLCARATGLNTLGWSGKEEDTGYKVNVAEGAKGLIAFLDANHIAYQRSDEACSDDAPAPNAPAPSTAAPSPAPKPASPTPSAPPAGK